MFEIMDSSSDGAVIKVIGVGGCGSNAVDHMIAKEVGGVEFICANTDAQALNKTKAKTVIQIGNNITRGLGAGAKPEIGRDAAIEDRDAIAELIEGTDMLFITAGMGGGTGTGAAPIIAQVAKDMGILTVAVVTKPFSFEGKRERVAEEGLAELQKYVDSLIIIPNEKLIQVLGKNVPFKAALGAANDVLHDAVSGIAEFINVDGLINVDFADVRTVMSEMGMAMMGTGKADGPDRARIAAEQAAANPLLEEVNLTNVRGILVNITSTDELTMEEYYNVMNTVKGFAAPDATVIVGSVFDEDVGDMLRVTLVATGLNSQPAEAAQPELKVVKDEKPVVAPTETDENSKDENLDVFAANTKRVVVDEMEKNGVDKFDIPTFLRKHSSN